MQSNREPQEKEVNFINQLRTIFQPGYTVFHFSKEKYGEYMPAHFPVKEKIVIYTFGLIAEVAKIGFWYTMINNGIKYFNQ